jgi:S1-C subfamily serine protease
MFRASCEGKDNRFKGPIVGRIAAMKKYALCCLVSSLIGGMTVVCWYEGLPATQLAAQEFVRPAAQPPLTEPRQTAHGPDVVERLPPDDLTPEERVNIAVYDRVNRGVVNINTKGVRAESFFFLEIPTEGMGSGSVLDKQGHILTNYHVVEGAREIEVSLFNGKSFPAQRIGEDASSDLAVIRIEAPPDMLHPLEIGDSTHLKVGQRAFAVGNPFGLERTLTTGVISSLNRSLPSRNHREMRSIIQIDAAVNPGSSGGPLLDSRGRLIGMTTAIASRTGQNTGVGFAIPAGTISRNLPQLINKGRVVRPDAGIAVVYQTEHGLLIAALAAGGPAERAGLRGPQIKRERKRQGPFVYETQQVDRAAADLIVGVDGTSVSTADEFLSLIESHKPGEEVTLNVVRQGQEIVVRVVLGEAEP